MPSLVEIGPVVLEKSIFFKKLSIYFYYFPIIFPFGRVWPGILCANCKFDCNWPSGSGEDEHVPSLQTDGRTNGRTERRTDGRTDRRRTTGDQKSSLALSAQTYLRTTDPFQPTWILFSLIGRLLTVICTMNCSWKS